jgi:integrase
VDPGGGASATLGHPQCAGISRHRADCLSQGLSVFTGARKGEIRGLLWEDYDGFSIRVKQAVWRSHVDEPKREKSKGAIPVMAQLKLFLERHRARSGNPRQGYILRARKGNP